MKPSRSKPGMLVLKPETVAILTPRALVGVTGGARTSVIIQPPDFSGPCNRSQMNSCNSSHLTL